MKAISYVGLSAALAIFLLTGLHTVAQRLAHLAEAPAVVLSAR
jgi:hypothetical protein